MPWAVMFHFEGQRGEHEPGKCIQEVIIKQQNLIPIGRFVEYLHLSTIQNKNQCHGKTFYNLIKDTKRKLKWNYGTIMHQGLTQLRLSDKSKDEEE